MKTEIIMKNTIIKLLEKYEDRIMKNTLGSSIDEYGNRYAEVYRWEWKDHKDAIGYTINKLLGYGININSMGMAYIIVNEWGGVMTFDNGDLDMDNLIKVCEDILIDLVFEQKSKIK